MIERLFLVCLVVCSVVWGGVTLRSLDENIDREYYDNGNLKSETPSGGFGVAKEYYENGNLKQEISYSLFHNGNKTWQRWYNENGDLEAEAFFYGKEIIYKAIYDGDKLITARENDAYASPFNGTYINDGDGLLVHEYRKTNYKDFDIEDSYIFDDLGIDIGDICEDYSDDFRASIKIPYKNGKKNGMGKMSVECLDGNFIVLIEGWEIPYNDNKISGSFVKIKSKSCEDCPWGEEIREIPYKNGKKNGIYKRYGYETPYKDGKKNGVEKSYYYSGKLMRETPYKDGKLNGVWKEYYESGKLKGEGNDDGAKEYYESGKLKSKTLYKDNKENGMTKYYKHFNENGTLHIETTYKDNNAISGKCGNGKVLTDEHLWEINNPYIFSDDDDTEYKTFDEKVAEICK